MSDDAALRERALRVLGVLDRRDSVATWNAAHPTHPKGPDGKWADTPGLPDLPDVQVKSSWDSVSSGDFRGLKRIGGQRGSNLAGVYEADDGSKWYVKAQKSVDHARNEALTAALYREALHEGPQVHVGQGAPGMDGPQTASEWLDTDGPIDLSDERALRDVRFGFATDAWLANWDVAGLSMDNIEMQGGFPIRIDSGGGLSYRAQGGEKGAAFGDTVTEWDSLRDPKRAPQASRLFGDITRDELIQSADQVKGVTRQRIRELVAEHDLPDTLAERLIARREDIGAKAEQLQLEAEAERGEDRVNGLLANRHALAAAPTRLTDRDKGAADLEAELTFDDDPGWSDKTHQASTRAIRFYRNGTYRQIGSYLREDGDSTMMIRESADDPGKREDVDMHVALIDQVMEESKLKDAVMVWRGIDDGKKVFGDHWSDDMTGVEWDELSFPSTSADPDVGSIFNSYGGALMRWHVPAGVGAVRLDGWKSNARHTAEAELLLDRNLRARVIADRSEDIGRGRQRRVLDVEVTPIYDAEGERIVGRASGEQMKRRVSPTEETDAPENKMAIERLTMGYPVDAVRAPAGQAQRTVPRAQLRAVVAREVQALLLEMRHPGHPDQKVHGRRGPKAAVKAAVKKAVKKAAHAASKASKSPATGTDALPRQNRQMTLRQAAQGTNPKFGTTDDNPTYRDAGRAGQRWTAAMGPLPSGAYEQNCTNCVQAFEMRMRGYDVQAAPLDVLGKYGYAAGRTFGETDEMIAASWRLPDGSPHGRSFGDQQWRSFEQIDAEVATWPEGGRGVITTGRHIFNVVNVRGKAQYIESQYDASPTRVVTTLYKRKFRAYPSPDGQRQEAKLIRLDDLSPAVAIHETVLAVQ